MSAYEGSNDRVAKNSAAATVLAAIVDPISNPCARQSIRVLASALGAFNTLRTA